MSVSQKNTRIIITIPKEVKAQLEKAALRENRSISNYVSTLIQNDLKQKNIE